MAGALLVCATAVAYLPAMRGGFVWDDDSMLTGNPLIRAADGLRQFWFSTKAADYWPVTSTTLWAEWRLWGMNPLGYHATNLALHLAEALLVWAILSRLRAPGAYLAALLFALHPVNVESVAWIAQRKNLMAMLFYLVSIACFLRTDPAGPVPPAGGATRGRGAWYWLSLGAFILAMLSKGSVAILPVVLLGLIAWHRPLARRDFLDAAPFFLAAAALAAVDVWFQGHGSAEVIRSAGWLERVLGAGAVTGFYLSKALLPVNLNAVYPQWSIRPADWLWWLPLLAAAGLTVFLGTRRRGWGRAALFAWAYFCVALVPVMGFTTVYFMRYSLVADHYQHLAILGVVALAAAGWSRWARATGGPLPWIAAAAASCILGFLTWRQCGAYRDVGTYYARILEGNPDCWMAHDNLGDVLRREHRPYEAIAQYEQALRIRPGYAEAENNIGTALVDAGRVGEAIPRFEESLRLKPGNPATLCNLGLALAAAGRWPEAVPRFEEAVRIRPDYAEAEDNLGVALARTGREAEGLAHVAEAVRLDPGLAEARYNLGTLLAQAGRLPEAVGFFAQALRLKPDYYEARLNLGHALELLGRHREAADEREAAARMKQGPPAPGGP